MSHGVAKGPKTCLEFGLRSKTMCPTSFCMLFFTHNRNEPTLGTAPCARRLIKDASAKPTLWVREEGQPSEATLLLRERVGFVQVTLSLQRSCGMTSALFSRLSEDTRVSGRGLWWAKWRSTWDLSLGLWPALRLHETSHAPDSHDPTASFSYLTTPALGKNTHVIVLFR